MVSEQPRGARRRRVRIAAIVLGSVLLLTLPVHAEPSDSERETARSLMARAREERGRGDLPSALKSFSAADTIMRVPTTTLAVAQTQADLGLFVEAHATLLRMNEAPKNEPPPFQQAREEGRALQAELARRTARLRIVFSPPPRAPVRVSIDGHPIVEPAPADGYWMNPGPHEVSVEYEGRSTLQSLAVNAGETKRLQIALPLTVKSPAFVDKPLLPEAANGFGAPSTPVYLLSGLALGGMASGITFGVVGRSRKGKLEDQCAPTCSQDSVNEVRSMYTLANVSFALSAASAIAASVMYWVDNAHAMEGSSSAARVRIDVSPAPGGLAAGVAGRF